MKIESWEEDDDKETVDIKHLHFWLYILGTEKHDSRRIDNQLRGRSGRQWDPGISEFFVALDDEIMRKMWGETIMWIAWQLLSKDELEKMELTQKQFTKSIERAQKQMEWWHFSIRKHLFDYDSVINKQRTRIYAKRDELLNEDKKDTTDDLITEIKGYIDEVVQKFVDIYTWVRPRELDELIKSVLQITWENLTESELQKFSNPEDMKDYIVIKLTKV